MEASLRREIGPRQTNVKEENGDRKVVGQLEPEQIQSVQGWDKLVVLKGKGKEQGSRTGMDDVETERLTEGDDEEEGEETGDAE